MMSPRLALAFTVTIVTAVLFVVTSLLAAVAAFRWAFDAATPGELGRALAVWVAAFVLMQCWSFYLRIGKP